MVHTAPSHGAEDFATGVKYRLDRHSDVDAAGVIRNGLPEYDGMKVFEANAPIVELLKAARRADARGEAGALLSALLALPQSDYFPGDRAVVHLDGNADERGGRRLRSRTLEEIKKVKWDPAWGEERISNMIATRPDWCISRQRIWGVPIAVFLCAGLRQAAERSGDQSQGGGAVCALGRGRLVHAGSRQRFFPRAPNARIAREQHSRKKPTSSTCGSSPDRAMPPCSGHEPNLPWPADLYLEGGDQYRGWFHVFPALRHGHAAAQRLTAWS